MFVAVFTTASRWILSSVLHASGRPSHTLVFKIRINIFLPYKLRSTKWPVPFRFSNSHCVRISLFHWTFYLQGRSIIIIIIIIIIINSFLQGIYTYIPETNYIPREYSVAAILLLLFVVLISLVPVLNLLYFYISTFRSMCAVPNMAVFCSSLTSCFPGVLLTYFLKDFEMVAPVITGVTFVCTFHMRCISIVRCLYFRIFSASHLITFLSPEIATSINVHLLLLLLLLLLLFLAVATPAILLLR